jgi:hypothetical protein
MVEINWHGIGVFLISYVLLLFALLVLYRALRFFFATVLGIKDRPLGSINLDAGQLRYVIYAALFYAAMRSGLLAVLVVIVVSTYIEKECSSLREIQKKRQNQENKTGK